MPSTSSMPHATPSTSCSSARRLVSIKAATTNTHKRTKILRKLTTEATTTTATIEGPNAMSIKIKTVSDAFNHSPFLDSFLPPVLSVVGRNWNSLACILVAILELLQQPFPPANPFFTGISRSQGLSPPPTLWNHSQLGLAVGLSVVICGACGLCGKCVIIMTAMGRLLLFRSTLYFGLQSVEYECKGYYYQAIAFCLYWAYCISQNGKMIVKL